MNVPAIETIAEHTYPGTSDYQQDNYTDVSNPLKSFLKLLSKWNAMVYELYSKGADSKEKRAMWQNLELSKR